MVFSDYTESTLTNFAAVLENYGVKAADGIVFEGDNQHYGMQMPYYCFLLLTVQTHPLKQTLPDIILSCLTHRESRSLMMLEIL